MFERRRGVPMLIALAFTAALTHRAVVPIAREAAPPPGAPSRSVIGSWKLVDDQNGEILFATYSGGHFDGTVSCVSEDNAKSMTHGSWSRTGTRNFSESRVGFVYDETGNAHAKIEFKSRIVLDESGESAIVDFDFNVTQLSDGRVIGSGASTAVGERVVGAGLD